MDSIRYQFSGVLSAELCQDEFSVHWRIAQRAGKVPARAIGDRVGRIQLLREAHAVLVRRRTDRGPT